MAVKARTSFRLIGSGRFSWDIENIGSGVQTTKVVNVPGAKVGDAVVMTADTAQAGFCYDGRVTGPATITLRVVNASGSAADPAATLVTVVVLRA